MLFAEYYNRRCPIKNFTDRLNLHELQLDNLSVKVSPESVKKYVPVR